MPFINNKEDKYRIVDEILNATDYYHVLGVKRNATSEEIRRAYIKVNVVYINISHLHSIRKVEYVTQINLFPLIPELLKAFKV
jgi:preprotein translocase subunit Sec63